MDSLEEDIGASDGKGQHADHEGQNQEDGVDRVDSQNNRRFGEKSDREDGRNCQADTREHRSQQDIHGAL